jgi:hypothetical protein
MIKYEYTAGLVPGYILNYGRDSKMPLTSPAIYNWAKQNKIFLFDFDALMFAPEITETFLRQYIKKIVEDYKYVLVCEQHPFNIYEDMYKYRHKQLVDMMMPLIKTMFVTSDWEWWNSKKVSNYTFLPFWYFDQRRFSINTKYNKYLFDRNKKYLFSCLNRSNLRPEKLYNFIKCYERKSADWFLTAYKLPHLPNNVLGCTEEQNKLWQTEIRPGLTEFINDLENSDINENNKHPVAEPNPTAFSLLFPGFTQARINLAIEHSMEFPIASEKTFKPFVAQQVPIFLGYAGIATCIRNLGFDVFDDIIDHSAYDSIGIKEGEKSNWEHWVPRIDAVHHLIDKLLTTNLREILTSDAVQARLIQNKNYFYSSNIDDICVTKLNTLLNTVKANNIFTDIR